MVKTTKQELYDQAAGLRAQAVRLRAEADVLQRAAQAIEVIVDKLPDSCEDVQ